MSAVEGYKNIEECTNRDEWEAFVRHGGGTYLQSWDWGAFQHVLGNPVYRFCVRDDDGIVAACQVVEQVLGFGLVQWYVGDGPIVRDGISKEQVGLLLAAVAEYAPRAAAYVRVERPDGVAMQGGDDLHIDSFSVVPAFRTVRPQYSVQLQLSGRAGCDELLAAMKSKTRYNIRLSKKRGVQVRVDSSDDAVTRFVALARETTSRDGFFGHALSYYEALLRSYRETGSLFVYMAEHEGDDLASIVVLHYNGTATYLYGASSSTKRELMASSFVQWQAICDAYDAGLSWYDFYGTTPLAENDGVYLSEDSDHPYAGITRFKLGFVPSVKAGRVVQLPDSIDIVRRPFAYQLLLLRRQLLMKNHTL